MSTPTSERLRGPAALAAALLALAGCEPASIGGAPGRASVNVGGQAIVVAAPPGFCIDGASTSVTAEGAFVLVSDCGLLGNAARAATPPVAAALTASISPTGLGAEGRSLADLERFAASPDGRAALGRSGRGDRVRILATETRGDVLYVLVEDGGPQPIAGVERRFWRAFLEVDGRIAALSVLGFEGSGVDAQQGLAHLSRFAEALKAANA